MDNQGERPGDVVIENKDPEREDIVVSTMSNEEQRRGGGFDDIAASVKEVAQKTGDVINKATESIGKAIESALSARDHVVMVRVNDDSLRGLDALVQSGIFKSRSESAAFLISEGIKAQQSLFNKIASRIAEIERLREELKHSIEGSDGEP